MKSFAVMAIALIFMGCAFHKDKCQCAGIFCDSPCSARDIMGFQKLTYFNHACNCKIPIGDQSLDETYRIPKSSFLMAPRINRDSLYIEMDLDPNTVSYSGDTVFYDSLIKDPYYPEHAPQPYAFDFFHEGNGVELSHKKAWLRQIRMEGVSDDAGDSHGLKVTYEFRAEWDSDWIQGEVTETSRDMLNP